jgi:DnaJ-class molecular chaperone
MNLYEKLNVEKDATQQEIKKQYYALSKIFHPDKPGGSTSDFNDICYAYSVLKDPELRKEYDETGEIKPKIDINAEAMQLIAGMFMDITNKVIMSGENILRIDMNMVLKNNIDNHLQNLRSKKLKNKR